MYFEYSGKILGTKFGLGVRGKFAHKQNSIYETIGHDPLKGSWELHTGIPGTLDLPSRRS